MKPSKEAINAMMDQVLRDLALVRSANPPEEAMAGVEIISYSSYPERVLWLAHGPRPKQLWSKYNAGLKLKNCLLTSFPHFSTYSLRIRAWPV